MPLECGQYCREGDWGGECKCGDEAARLNENGELGSISGGVKEYGGGLPVGPGLLYLGVI